MRFLALGLSTVLGVASAGCGVAASEKAPTTPAGYPRMAPRGPARQEVAAKSAPEPDRDSDGIPDKKDALPAGDISCEGANCLGGLLAAPAPGAGAPAAAGGAPAAAAQGTQAAQREGTYLIYTATLTMAVYQVEGALAQVEAIGKDAGGYLAARQDHKITIRVPRARFEETLKKIEATGDVVHRDVQAEDVSDEFVDTEIRLKNARAMRDRLGELLLKATVKDALEIEKELHRITEEIERMEGRLKLLRDKIAFSTITVVFDARAASLRTQPTRLPFPWLQSLGLPSLLRLNETK